jgi:hypothetical protein
MRVKHPVQQAWLVRGENRICDERTIMRPLPRAASFGAKARTVLAVRFVPETAYR